MGKVKSGNDWYFHGTVEIKTNLTPSSLREQAGLKIYFIEVKKQRLGRKSKNFLSHLLSNTYLIKKNNLCH
jgi:hypothetical protein